MKKLNPMGRLGLFAAITLVLVAIPAVLWASDVFEDVPDSNVFHDDIAWLAESGVTVGCNPPDNTRFCPSDSVTREQMAAFMRRLAENQVVDAATVDGHTVADIVALTEPGDDGNGVDMSPILERLDALEDRVETLQDDNQTLQTQIGDLEDDHQTLQTRVTSLENKNQTLQTRVSTLETDTGILQDLLAGVTRTDPETLRFEGMNLQVVNGTGQTTTTNGLGNLIIGYNEPGPSSVDRSGSHNLIVGMEHSYTSYGGLVAGIRNTISGVFATVTGGSSNTASGFAAAVTGGDLNTARGPRASVTGGWRNNANEIAASVSGGRDNTADDIYTSVSGGDNNTAHGIAASVSGGRDNITNHNQASVSGGFNNSALGERSSIAGGSNGTVTTDYHSLIGNQDYPDVPTP